MHTFYDDIATALVTVTFAVASVSAVVMTLARSDPSRRSRRPAMFTNRLLPSSPPSRRALAWAAVVSAARRRWAWPGGRSC
jgi:hypothetical protein